LRRRASNEDSAENEAGGFAVKAKPPAYILKGQRGILVPRHLSYRRLRECVKPSAILWFQKQTSKASEQFEVYHEQLVKTHVYGPDIDMSRPLDNMKNFRWTT
jgi:hypothetical protein